MTNEVGTTVLTEDQLRNFSPFWEGMIFAHYSPGEIKRCVEDPTWQAFRLKLKGLTLRAKFSHLCTYLQQHNSYQSRVQVTNYVNALKRGGLIK